MIKNHSFYFLILSCFCCFLMFSPGDAQAHNDCSTSSFESQIKYISNDGVKIAYTSNGKHNCPSIVFIHGFPFSGEQWVCQIEALKKDFHVVTLDLRGFGHSDKSLNVEYSYEAFVTDVEAVIKKLKLKNPVIVGFSFGSIVAELYAATHLNISKLILISPFAGQLLNGNGYTAGLDPAAIAPLFSLVNTNRNKFNQEFLNQAVPETCSAAKKVKNFLLPIEREMPTANINKLAPVFETGITNQLTNISVPTLIIYGSMDELINFEGVLLLRDLIPHYELLELAGGHMINLTQAKSVNHAIAEFVKKNPLKCNTCL